MKEDCSKRWDVGAQHENRRAAMFVDEVRNAGGGVNLAFTL